MLVRFEIPELTDHEERSSNQLQPAGVCVAAGGCYLCLSQVCEAGTCRVPSNHRTVQLCFTVKLHNCSVDDDTSPDFIPSGGGEED